MWSLLAFPAWGSGSPPEVLVLTSDRPEAVEVAEAYAAARQLPEGHVCVLAGLTPDARSIPLADFEALIRTPFEICRHKTGAPDEIAILVLIRGLPYQVVLPDGSTVSTEAALQIGRAADDAGLPLLGQGSGPYPWVPNPSFQQDEAQILLDYTLENPTAEAYPSASSITRDPQLPAGFDRFKPRESAGFDLTGNLYIVSRLDGFDFDDAMALVDRALLADGSFPTAPIRCMEGADTARAARDPECEFATRMLPDITPALWVSPHDPALSGLEVASYLTGAADLHGAIDGLTYVPGAFACNLTSFGAAPENFFCDGDLCPGVESQTSIARFIRAGATAAHGTVNEPYNHSFPGAGALLLYTQGYSLGESVFLAQPFLYWQNLLLGDPLVAPWAKRPVVSLPNVVIEGEPLMAGASHRYGVAELRVYMGGVRVATAQGSSVSWTPVASAGETLDVLVVAIANDDEVEHPSWALPTQLPRPTIAGWAEATVTVLAPPPLDTSEPNILYDEDGSVDGTPIGCYCQCSPANPGLGVLGPLLWLSLRRRSTSGGRRS